MSAIGSPSQDVASGQILSVLRDELRARGQRWTPQRRLILEVIGQTEGHVTGSELVELCRARDPLTTPSTVYRTLDVLESLGYLSHSHSADGREEFHVLPENEHGHIQCRTCGKTWELDARDSDAIARPLRSRLGFSPDIGHMTIVGRCADCSAADGA